MYNVAPYVERCVRSLEDQDILKEDYELICINDGSPDNCKEIVESLQKEFPNIILINQVNKGVSIARNNGIEKASGDYILFVDPDDYIKPNILEKRLTQVSNNALDVGLSGYIILNEQLEEEYRYELQHENNEVMSGVEYSKTYLRGVSETRDPNRAWAIFFKNHFIKSNKLFYLEGVPYLEDGEFMSRALCLAMRVGFINVPFYIRTTRPGSATHSKLFYSDKAITGFITAGQNLREFQKSNFLTPAQKIYLNQPIVKFCITAIIGCSDLSSIRKISRVRKELIKNNLNKLELEQCSKAYSKYGSYYNISIYVYLLYYIYYKAKASLKSKLKK